MSKNSIVINTTVGNAPLGMPSPFDREKKGDAGLVGKKFGSSYLKNETVAMADQRRVLEQEWLRQKGIGRVEEHQNENPEVSAAANPEEGEDFNNGIKQHPELDSQKFDGIDPSINPAPALNSEARTAYDNARNEQQLKKQLQLSNMPAFRPEPLKPR